MDKKQAAKYYSHLKFERNLTDNSVEAYLHDIEKLQKFADNLGKPLEALEQSDIETFLWGLRDVGITPTSQNRILAGIRSYYRFLRLEGELEADPTDCIDSPKLPEHVPTVLTLDEVNRVIAATDPTTCDGQRNRAILETLYSCGIACSCEGCPTKAGNWQIDLLLANVCKQNITRFPYEIVRLAEDIAGGLMVTLPSQKDFDSPVVVGKNGESIGEVCEKYFKTRDDVPTEDRNKVLRLLENLCLGTAAVGYRTESMHGAGSPQAQRIMISRQGNIQGKKQLAKDIAGIKE